jgi:hypothetical protein
VGEKCNGMIGGAMEVCGWRQFTQMPLTESDRHSTRWSMREAGRKVAWEGRTHGWLGSAPTTNKC